MQHGSLLINYDPELLAEVLLSRKSEEEFLTEIRTSTTAINQHLSQKIDFDQLKKLVLNSFEDQLKISLTPGDLSEQRSSTKRQPPQRKILNRRLEPPPTKKRCFNVIK